MTRTTKSVDRDLDAPGAERRRAASVAVVGARNGQAASHRPVGPECWRKEVGSRSGIQDPTQPVFQFLATVSKSLFRKGWGGSKGVSKNPGGKLENWGAVSARRERECCPFQNDDAEVAHLLAASGRPSAEKCPSSRCAAAAPELTARALAGLCGWVDGSAGGPRRRSGTWTALLDCWSDT